MDIETLVMQVLTSGDVIGTIKTLVVPTVIAVAGHVVLNYMKSVKAGSLKKLHETLAANHITLTDAKLAEIDAATKKAEAVVVKSATSALNKILDDFMVRHNQSTKEIKELQDTLYYVVAGLSEKVEALKKPGFDIADAVAAHKSVYSEPKERAVNPEQMQPLMEHPESLGSIGDLVGQPGHGYITVGGPYGVTSLSTGMTKALCGVTSGYVDMGKAQGVQFSYTAGAGKGDGNGSENTAEQVQSVVPGTNEYTGAATNTPVSDITIPHNTSETERR